MTASVTQVLLIEDNAGDVRLVREMLAEAGGAGFRLECVNRLAAGLSRLQESPAEVVLLDLGLPDSQGLATFSRVHARAPGVPVVVLSGVSDEQRAMEAVQAGAQDYLVKGQADAAVLARALRYAIERGRVQRALRESQERVRQMNAELERRVEARTAELEAANQELEAFTWSVSHDLRTPLRHLVGFSGVLREELGAELQAETRQHLEYIEGAARRMSQLIEALLKLSRVGRQTLDCRRTDLSELVEAVRRELEPDCAGRPIEWRIGALPEAECDAGLMRQVFANLLLNAIKFTRGRDPALIEIGAEESAVFVRDNGVGFEMKHHERMFNAFERLHRAEEFEGTGIGLATVRRIVRKHGGRVWAEGAPGRGATFYFILGTMYGKERVAAVTGGAGGSACGNL